MNHNHKDIFFTGKFPSGHKNQSISFIQKSKGATNMNNLSIDSNIIPKKHDVHYGIGQMHAQSGVILAPSCSLLWWLNSSSHNQFGHAGSVI